MPKLFKDLPDIVLIQDLRVNYATDRYRTSAFILEVLAPTQDSQGMPESKTSAKYPCAFTMKIFVIEIGIYQRSKFQIQGGQ